MGQLGLVGRICLQAHGFGHIMTIKVWSDPDRPAALYRQGKGTARMGGMRREDGSLRWRVRRADYHRLPVIALLFTGAAARYAEAAARFGARLISHRDRALRLG